jgi:hypothetical protein
MDSHTILTVLLTALFTVPLTAFGTWLVSAKLQDRDRELRRRDLLREAYATWMASEDEHLEALINFLQVSDPSNPLNHLTGEFAKGYGAAKTRSNTCGRVLQVLEADEAYLSAVYEIAKSIPHSEDGAWTHLASIARSTEGVIVWQPYTSAVNALIARLRSSRRLW